jgi:3',5'-cyclic-AMP phosphodiesterase
MIRFAQLSDLHIKPPGKLAYGRVDTAAALRNAVAAVNNLRQPVEFTLITGDLVDFGTATEYQYLHELLNSLDSPYYLIAGNHDDRVTLRKVFREHTYLGNDEFIQYSLDRHDLRVVALDTVVPSASHGELCDLRLDWLEKTLAAAPNAPTVIAMHHPPFNTFIGHMDEIGLRKGRERLEHIISAHPNVERVLCGHLHRSIDVRFAGTIASTCPAPAHQVSLDLSETAPSRFELEPPGFKVHAYAANSSVVSHTAHIGTWDGPFPFHQSGELID